MQNSRKIFILCDGGLGNRLAGMAAGILTARRLSLDPVVCWPLNNWCGCSVQDLFDLGDTETSRQGILDLFLPDSDRIYLIHQNQIGVPLSTQIPHGLSSEEKIKNMSQDVVFFTAKVPPHLPGPDIVQTLYSFAVADPIKKIVSDFCSSQGIDRSVYGLHLRKTDCVKLEEDRWFSHCQQYPGRRFFICSDDAQTEQRFRSLPNVVAYPKTSYVEKLQQGPWRQAAIKDQDGRIFPNNINRPRESVIQAWVDLLILSRTEIVGTTKSSFSLAARWLQQGRA